MLIWLLPLVAGAGTVDGGVQVAAFSSSFDFVADRFTGQTFNIHETEVSRSDVACYDEVGLRNLNVEVPIQKLTFDLNPSSLLIDVHFGRVFGEDMSLYAEDSDFFDACPSMDSIDFEFELTDGRILVELAPHLEAGQFVLEVIGHPQVVGDLNTDIAWVPDDLILSFVEDSIFEAIEDAIAEKVPALASAMVDTALFAGAVGDMQLDVELTDVDVNNSSLSIGMDVDTEWLGEGCTISGIASVPEGRNSRVNFGDGEGNDVAVAITEYQLNRLFHGAWADGLLCFEDGPLSEVAVGIESLFSTKIDNSQVDLGFSQAPAFTVDTDGITLRINGLHMALSGEVNGANTTLMALDADLSLVAEVSIDHAVSSFSLSLIQAKLDISAFEADPLLEDTEAAKARLTALLEGWAMETLAARISHVPLYGNLFHIADIYLRINAVDTEGGAVVIMGALFDGDDPAVDTEPPETLARITSADATSVAFEMDADDNADGPIAFSYRLNSEDWSPWSDQTLATIGLPEPGEHLLSVRARDAWLNIDPSPAMIVFVVDTAEDAQSGCQCASADPRPTGLWASLVIILMGGARRRE